MIQININNEDIGLEETYDIFIFKYKNDFNIWKWEWWGYKNNKLFKYNLNHWSISDPFKSKWNWKTIPIELEIEDWLELMDEDIKETLLKLSNFKIN